MRPLVFDGCVGFLHDAASGGRARAGVVLLSAHGFEELCSRRFLHCLAEAFAAAGFPTLRFDYHGTGDSAGSDEDGDRVATWLRNAHAAADRLKSETGAGAVIFLGLRLGAMLAARAAAERSDVAGLALLAPPASGKAYTREQTALGRMIAGGLPPAPAAGEPFDGIDVAGFPTTRATLEVLRTFSWESLPRLGAREALVLARGEAGAGPVRALESLGARVTLRPFPGYERLMCDPTASDVPLEVVDDVTRWALFARGSFRALMPSLPQQPATTLTQIRSVDWIEEPVAFGPGNGLVGIYCRPRQGRLAARSFVFLNAGAISRAGWARMTVANARTLASAGFASLRFDLAGLGDSAEPPARRLFLYSPEARADVVAALDWLAARGHDHVALVGACSGAFQAFHTALADARVSALVLVNQLCFVWGPSHALTLSGWKMARSVEVAAARRSADDGAGRPPWLEPWASRGFALAKAGAKRLLALLQQGTQVLAGLARVMGEARNPVAGWFETLARRGTRIVLVQGADDASREELARHMGPGGSRALALPGVSLHLIAATDHTLTPRHARRALAEQLLVLARSPNEGPSAVGVGAAPTCAAPALALAASATPIPAYSPAEQAQAG